jgi:hypothetical protein
MIEVANPAGRLITYRVRVPVDDGNAANAAAQLASAVKAIAGRVVVCTDLTDARTFAPETAERWVKVMRADNPRLERSAILLGDSATVSLQLERMVREAQHPDRRIFHDAGALAAWLAPVLDDAERAALERFLDAAL